MSIGAIVVTVRAHDVRHAAYHLTAPLPDPRCRATIDPATPALPGVG